MIFCYQFSDPPMNDWHRNNYRDHTLAFPITGGVLSTLCWEGLREAVDDMRYLRTLQKAADERGVRGEVDVWLESLDPYAGDLGRIRSQITDRILRLQQGGS
jgi:hypothetical protein